MHKEVMLQNAIALHRQGNYDDAKRLYRSILRRTPADAGVLHLLGLLQYQTGQHDEARKLVRNAILLEPKQALMHFNLAKILTDSGDLDGACKSYREAIRLDPGFAAAHANLANNLNALRRHHDAIAAARSALAHDAQDLVARQALASALRHLGELEAARAELSAAYAQSRQPGFLLQDALATSPICTSITDIQAERARTEEKLAQALAAGGQITRPETDVGMTYFYMSYHGLCNRDLFNKAATALRALAPTLETTAEHCREYAGPKQRLRVGFISAFMHSHSIGKTTRGLLAHLDRTKFEVLALHIAPYVDDEISRFIKAHADKSLVIPLDLVKAREIIGSLQLDVLFYQDIGMEPFSYFLAFSRLAPVQCLSFGHPDTTGIPNMDWFVSSRLYEPDDGAAHYSERLFMLEDCGTLAYYYRPSVPERNLSRDELGLPPDKHIYLCPQTLFKLHPEFDAILAGILDRDPDACLVLLEGTVKDWVRHFLARLTQAAPSVSERIVVLPKLSPDAFTALVAAADVMLDPIHFNGMNTSLEAFAVGTPVVTLPGAMQRGRHTFGMYTAMGIADAVATGPDDYIRIAVELGTDREARRRLSDRILAANHCLFENTAVVREFERFFEFAVAAALRERAVDAPN